MKLLFISIDRYLAAALYYARGNDRYGKREKCKHIRNYHDVVNHIDKLPDEIVRKHRTKEMEERLSTENRRKMRIDKVYTKKTLSERLP